MPTVGSGAEELGTTGFPTLRVKLKVKVEHVGVWRSPDVGVWRSPRGAACDLLERYRGRAAR